MSPLALDTSGHFHVMPGHPLHRFMAVNRLEWSDLSPFAQGYVEAMPWDELNEREFERRCKTIGQGADDPELGFRHLSPEALALILKDCESFLKLYDSRSPDVAYDGVYFWQDRQHGLYADDLPPLTVTLSDEGKVCLAVAS